MMHICVALNFINSYVICKFDAVDKYVKKIKYFVNYDTCKDHEMSDIP